jgi:hypothetical protein
MLEVGCLFEALRKALGALVEQKLSDVVTLWKLFVGRESKVTPCNLVEVIANFGWWVCDTVSDSYGIGEAVALQMSKRGKGSSGLEEKLRTIDNVGPRGPCHVMAANSELRVARS